MRKQLNSFAQLGGSVFMTSLPTSVRVVKFYFKLNTFQLLRRTIL